MKAAGEPMYPSGGWAGRAGAVGYCRAGDKSWAGKWEQGREGQGTSSSERAAQRSWLRAEPWGMSAGTGPARKRLCLGIHSHSYSGGRNTSEKAMF